MIPKGLIASIQIENESSFFPLGKDVVNFSKEAEKGGCVALRIKDYYNVRCVKLNTLTCLPVIGLTKKSYSNGDVYITPTYEDGMELLNHGADFVAMDATGRNGYNEIEKVASNGLVIGDISDLSQASSAIESGCCALTTALSGYDSSCKTNTCDEPDYELLQNLIEKFPNIPILAEGRYWERSQVETAFNLGAHNVVVGSAISRPHLITKRLAGQ